MSKASEAIASLDKAAWGAVEAAQRLSILEEIQLNIYNAMDELGAAEAKMKNERLGGEEMYTADDCKITTVVPISNNVNGAIDLYKALKAGKPFTPAAGKPVKVSGDNDLWDVPVCPNTAKEMVFYATRKDKLRVKGEPKQVGPYDKPTKLVAILGAGNYSSAVEVVKAIFFDNCVAVHKPHPLNAQVDEVWARIFKPLVAAKALAFCTHDQGPSITTDARVDVIYFTGGVETAKAIMKGTKAPLICESGGVNPTLVVPGEWTDAQLTHHAQQLVTAGKINGGHVCARPQLIVTSKNWPQRDKFLEELEKAAQETTYAAGSYYPTAADVMERFAKQYPTAKRIQPENATHGKHADFLLITDDSPDGYATKNEAFCQVVAEVALDTTPDATDFLRKAVEYANKKVHGSLCAGILIDDKTRQANEDAYQTAVTDLEYGSIGVNLLPVHVFFSQYLIWGVKEEEDYGKPLVSGNGNFGNAFGFQNVQKSIFEDSFVSPLQLRATNKAAMASTISALARYSIWPSWYGLIRFLVYAVPGSMKSKDW